MRKRWKNSNRRKDRRRFSKTADRSKAVNFDRYRGNFGVVRRGGFRI